jgi:hypothetical protein
MRNKTEITNLPIEYVPRRTNPNLSNLLVNTQLQLGESTTFDEENRFNGFSA